MKIANVFQSRDQKNMRKHADLINDSIRDTSKNILNETAKLIPNLEKMDFGYACGLTTSIESVISLQRKGIESYITLRVKPIFDLPSGNFSYPFSSIKQQADSVFCWLDEISEMTKVLRAKLEVEKPDPDAVGNHVTALIRKIGYDNTAQELANSLLFLQMEYLLFIRNNPNEKIAYMFDNMDLHPTVRKHSEKLFKSGHYAQAIFEACKALIMQVKKKSCIEASDKDLMGQAFGVEHANRPLRITKYPLLQLNPLESLEEIDEQEGFMHLFIGLVVGIRNPKAHAIVEQQDPYRTLQYLSLISLLAKRLDEAKLHKNLNQHE